MQESWYANCNGKYIQFIDSDDEPLPDKISTQLNVLEKNKELIMTMEQLSLVKNILNANTQEKQIKEKQNMSSFSLSSVLDYIEYFVEEEYISERSWYPLFGSEDLLFELNGLPDHPIMHTSSKKPLLKKWLHQKIFQLI